MATADTERPAVLDWDALAADFEAFHSRFATLFGRSEPRGQARKHMLALMGPTARCNGWQMAEAAGDRRPDRMQRLLYANHWSADEARDRLEDFVVEQFGDPAGTLVLDETGFLKKGDASVGVQRQYSGTAGKIENCQIGVFLSYATQRGHMLVDRRLYLPESWCKDRERRRRAHVPEEVTFKTKPELALEMLQAAWRRGVPTGWVAGDEVYGDDPELRQAIADSDHRYVLGVAANTPVWTKRPRVVMPGPRIGSAGRPRIRPRLAARQPKASTVAKVGASWPASDWHRFAAEQGEKGPIEYDWAAARVVESRDHLPARDLWLLARRSISKPSEVAYFLANAEPSVTRVTLAKVASSRYTIEQCFEEEKDDVGLDHYEVRRWESWHRYITLGMMAAAWLASVRAKLVDGCFQVRPPPLAPSEGEKSPRVATSRAARRSSLRGVSLKRVA